MTSLQQQRKSVFTSVVESVTYYIEALNNSGVHTICCKSLFEFGFVGVGIVQTKKTLSKIQRNLFIIARQFRNKKALNADIRCVTKKATTPHDLKQTGHI